MASLKFRHYTTEAALKGTKSTVQEALNTFDIGDIVFIDDVQKQYIITGKNNNVVTYKIYYGKSAVVDISGSGAERMLTWSDGSETKVTINDVAHATNADIAGSASTSSKWANSRTLTLTGSVKGSVSIDGSANVSLNTETNHSHTFASLTSKPTTISGYGIGDAYTKEEVDMAISTAITTALNTEV